MKRVQAHTKTATCTPTCRQCKLWRNIFSLRLRVLDNGGTTIDRYTVILREAVAGTSVWHVLTMSDNPQDPRGVNLYSHTIDSKQAVRTLEKDGTRLPLEAIPEQVQQAIIQHIYNNSVLAK